MLLLFYSGEIQLLQCVIVAQSLLCLPAEWENVNAVQKFVGVQVGLVNWMSEMRVEASQNVENALYVFHFF